MMRLIMKQDRSIASVYEQMDMHTGLSLISLDLIFGLLVIFPYHSYMFLSQ